ncbi:hypothetical protein D3C83_215760 [compost metagenome]
MMTFTPKAPLLAESQPAPVAALARFTSVLTSPEVLLISFSSFQIACWRLPKPVRE